MGDWEQLPNRLPEKAYFICSGVPSVGLKNVPLLTDRDLYRTIKIMDANNSFDQLAEEISATERLEMLKRLESTVDPSSQVLESSANEDTEKITIEVKLQSESFFLRIWLFIKSLFLSSDLKHEYGMYLLSKKAAVVEQDYPDVINYKKGLLSNNFYIQLGELKRAANFFKPGIALYDEDPGKFYVYLGSLLLPDFTMRAEEHLNFSLLSSDKVPSNELRSSLLRQLDDLMLQIPPALRNNLYGAVKNAEWIKNFVKLPFDHFLSRFFNITGTIYTCQFEAASGDLAQFAKVLCNGGRMRSEVLEALATFTAAAQTSDNETELREKSVDLLKKSIEQISFIKIFITAIPLRTVTALAYHSVFWEPDTLEGAEDWFIKFKTQWKKKFDYQWDSWVKNKKREEVKSQVMQLLSVSSFPLLPCRPWESILSGISFARELTTGFLYEFFHKIYPVYNKSLRILMAEGEFVQRDNRMEFTDTYSELNHLAADLERFNTGLSPQGDHGKLFAKIMAENIRTVYGKSQIDSIMFSLESEASLFFANFSAAGRSLLSILGGITDEIRDVNYGTLQNLSTIQGKSNTQFRAQLKVIRQGIMQILDLLRNLEAMDIS